MIFDLGGVVLGWAPELAYAQVLPADEVPAFLTDIDFYEWNRLNDTGRSFAAAEDELISRFPGRAAAVRAYRQHFSQTLTGMIPGTGAVIAELQQAGVRLLALTNWSAETFPHALRRFGLLRRFEHILVSGAEGVAKPDRAIFELLCRRHAVDARRTVFVDDASVNVAAAASVGMTALRFRAAGELRFGLSGLGLLPARPVLTRPIYHLTTRQTWQAARESGEFRWSSRDLSYEAQGFVHCSYGDQVAGVAARVYGGFDPADLLVLQLELPVDNDVVVEEGEPGEWYPHLFAPLTIGLVSRAQDLTAFLASRPAEPAGATRLSARPSPAG